MKIPLRLAAICCALLGLASCICSPAQAFDITWVSFHDTDSASAAAMAAGLTDASDIGYTDLLAANGHTVNRFLTHEPLTADDLNVLNGSDLVIIGRAVNSGHYDPPTDWNTGVTAPVIITSGYLLRSNRLNLTDGSTMVDTVDPMSLMADNPAHPVFDGISLDGSDVMTNVFANVVTENGALQRGVSINPANLVGGSLIASSTEAATAGGAVIAEWPVGAELNNGEFLSGRRMAFLTGSREVDGVTSETAGFYDLTDDGAAMFLNAVNYMGTPIPEPASVALGLLGIVSLGLLRRRR